MFRVDLKRLAVFFNVSIMALTFQARADSDACSAKNIQVAHISINASEKFDLKFEVVRTASTGRPTILYIPGGPGQPSIGDSSIAPLIPDEYGLILTDPRGVGCNDSQKFKFSDFSTAHSASDLLAILKEEGLSPSEVILYGKSYGTILATVTADLNSQQGHRPFQMIVLEGVDGRANAGDHSWDGYISAARDYFAQRPGLSEKVESAIVSHNVDRKRFAQFLVNYLYEGNMGHAGHPLDEPLNLMTDGLNFKVFDEEWLGSSESGNIGKVAAKVWTAVACSEMGSSDRALSFVNGGIQVTSHEDHLPLGCKGRELFRPYDSKSMQLSERLVYLEGSEDPATPVASQAKYHFDNQRRSPRKTFFLFGGLGHSVLAAVEDAWVSDSNTGFSKKIWLSDFEPKAVKSLLNKWPIEVDDVTEGNSLPERK